MAPFVEGDLVEVFVGPVGGVGGAMDKGVEAFGCGGVTASVDFEVFEGIG